MSDDKRLALEHPAIWLQPACCADPYEGRLWCQDPDPEPCPHGVPWTRFVREDIHDMAWVRHMETVESLNAKAIKTRLCSRRVRLFETVGKWG